MPTFQIRPLIKNDREWVASVLMEYWGSPKIITRGNAFQADRLPGFAAIQNDKPVGAITFRIDGDECEIGSMNSLVERIGIGSALVKATRDAAVSAKCRRLWLITTNDNTQALHFWQKRGFVLVAVYPNAIEASRRLKPEIPLIGNDGIPIRDEIELEMRL